MTFALSPFSRILLASGLLAGSLAQAQAATPVVNMPANRPSSLGWQVCQAMKDDTGGQLACYQQWADSQLPANTPPAALTTAPANLATGKPETEILLLPSLNTEAPDGKPIGCRNTQYSELSRFWELQRGTDLGRDVVIDVMLTCSTLRGTALIPFDARAGSAVSGVDYQSTPGVALLDLTAGTTGSPPAVPARCSLGEPCAVGSGSSKESPTPEAAGPGVAAAAAGVSVARSSTG